MLRTILTLFCILCMVHPLSAQRGFRQGAAVTPIPVRMTEVRRVEVPRIEDYADFSSLSLQPDTVYASAIVKRWGWMEPLHVISREEARHCEEAYRFTNRNAAGHWQRLDCIDAYGRPKTGNFNTYLVLNGDNDDYKDKDWNEKVQQTCGFDMVADASGRELLQERAYDADGSLVYVFTRTKVAPGKYLCAYNDGVGLPAEMRTNEGYTYGTLVHMWDNSRGYVSRTSFVDAEGRDKPNYDSAACSNFIYDSKGNTTGYWSSNLDGSRVIDVCGNSGMMQEFDAWGNEVKVTVMDAQWKPMTYVARDDDPSNVMNGVMVLMRDYDRYGRMTRFWFADADGHRITNAAGLYERRCKYNDRGLQTEVCDYGRDGKPIETLAEGIASYRVEYDENGLQTDIYFMDALDRPCSAEGQICRRHTSYDKDGNCVGEEQYSIRDGQEKLTFLKSESDTQHYYYYGDGTCTNYFYDDMGRQVLYAYMDTSGNPLDNDDGYAFDEYKYTPTRVENGRITELLISDTYYDKDSSEVFVDNFSTELTRIDSLRFTKTVRRYAYKNPYEMYQLQFDSNFDVRYSQQNMDEFENLCRGAGVSDMCYYDASVKFTPGGQTEAIIAHDEWGEPDYMYNKNGDVYSYNVMRKPAGDYYYDEDDRLITDFAALRDRLPKYMSVEVTDTTANAFKAGLRSNDILLRYGYFEQPDAMMTDEAYKGNWAAKACLSASLGKNVEVLRLNTENHTFSIHRFVLNDKNLNEQGLKVHVIYRTRKQEARVRQALDSLALLDTLELPLYRQPIAEDAARQEADSMVMILPNTFTPSAFNQYSRNVNAPALALGAEMDIDGQKMVWKHGDGKLRLQHMLDTYVDSAKAYPLNIWFSADGYMVDSLSLNTSIQETLAATPVICAERVKRLALLYDMWRHPEKCDSVLAQADKDLLDEAYQQGQVLFSDECNAQAWAYFSALSRRQYKDAYSYMTAMLLDFCNNTQEELHEAEKWNRKAMRSGDNWGLLRLGLWHQERKDYKQAIRCFSTLEQKHDGYRQRALGQLDECYKLTNDSIGRLKNSLYWQEMKNDTSRVKGILRIAKAYREREPLLVADVYANIAYIVANNYGQFQDAYIGLQKVRSLRGDLKCYDKDYSYVELFCLQKAAENDSTLQKELAHYLDNKLMMLHFPKNNAKARVLGLQGDYFLMQMDQYEVTCMDAWTEWRYAPEVKRPSLYLMKGSKVVRVDFDSDLLEGRTYETLTPSRRESIIRHFHRWKANHPKEFDIE